MEKRQEKSIQSTYQPTFQLVDHVNTFSQSVNPKTVLWHTVPHYLLGLLVYRAQKNKSKTFYDMGNTVF